MLSWSSSQTLGNPNLFGTKIYTALSYKPLPQPSKSKNCCRVYLQNCRQIHQHCQTGQTWFRVEQTACVKMLSAVFVWSGWTLSIPLAAQQKQELYEATLQRYEQLIIVWRKRLACWRNGKQWGIAPKVRTDCRAYRGHPNKNEVLEEMSQLRMMLNLRENVFIEALMINHR